MNDTPFFEPKILTVIVDGKACVAKLTLLESMSAGVNMIQREATVKSGGVDARGEGVHTAILFYHEETHTVYVDAARLFAHRAPFKLASDAMYASDDASVRAAFSAMCVALNGITDVKIRELATLEEPTPVIIDEAAVGEVVVVGEVV